MKERKREKKDGKKIGKKEAEIEIAKELLKSGMDKGDVIKITNLSEEEIDKIINIK